MRKLANYIKQCFCKHEFIVQELIKERNKIIAECREYTLRQQYVYMRCNKCGYHTGHVK